MWVWQKAKTLFGLLTKSIPLLIFWLFTITILLYLLLKLQKLMYLLGKVIVANIFLCLAPVASYVVM